MLALSEFFVSVIADAPAGSLVLPRSKYERLGIVGTAKDNPFFVLLGDDHRFEGFPASGNTSHKGVIVPNIGIEVDETSVGEGDSWDIPLGSIVSKSGQIGVLTTNAGSFGSGRFVASLGPTPASEVSAFFSKWRVFIGQGAEKRTLVSVDAKAIS